MLLLFNLMQFFTKNNLDFLTFNEQEVSSIPDKTEVADVFAELSALVPIAVQMQTEISDAHDKVGKNKTIAAYKNIVIPNLAHWEDSVFEAHVQQRGVMPPEGVLWFLLRNCRDTILFNFQGMIFMYTMFLNGGATLEQS